MQAAKNIFKAAFFFEESSLHSNVAFEFLRLVHTSSRGAGRGSIQMLHRWNANLTMNSRYFRMNRRMYMSSFEWKPLTQFVAFMSPNLFFMCRKRECMRALSHTVRMTCLNSLKKLKCKEVSFNFFFSLKPTFYLCSVKPLICVVTCRKLWKYTRKHYFYY